LDSIDGLALATFSCGFLETEFEVTLLRIGDDGLLFCGCDVALCGT
jgi:hypothetical protein